MIWQSKKWSNERNAVERHVTKVTFVPNEIHIWARKSDVCWRGFFTSLRRWLSAKLLSDEKVLVWGRDSFIFSKVQNSKKGCSKLFFTTLSGVCIKTWLDAVSHVSFCFDCSSTCFTWISDHTRQKVRFSSLHFWLVNKKCTLWFSVKRALDLPGIYIPFLFAFLFKFIPFGKNLWPTSTTY